jgi:hypothetical protein
MISVLERVVAYAAALLILFSFLVTNLVVVAQGQGKTDDLAILARSSNSSTSPESAETKNGGSESTNSEPCRFG